MVDFGVVDRAPQAAQAKEQRAGGGEEEVPLRAAEALLGVR
jgi:hypothetical protein